jgi:hypothetical protein
MINCLNALAVDEATTSAPRALIVGLTVVVPSPVLLSRTLDPWLMPVRTLDALHLAACDQRMAEAARGLGLGAMEPE